LKWSLKIGPNLKALESVEERTGRTPAMLLDWPLIHITVEWVWAAFSVLDKGRQWGFNGPQPILVSEIEAYARLNEIEDRSDLVRYIQAMDGEYLEHHREKLKREHKKHG
jgi:hypothetical protein